MCSTTAQGAAFVFALEAVSEDGRSTAASSPELAPSSSPDYEGFCALPESDGTGAPGKAKFVRSTSDFQEAEPLCEQLAAARLIVSVRKWALNSSLSTSA
jgi:hypothetical protein